jgi:hypothetical protein
VTAREVLAGVAASLAPSLVTSFVENIRVRRSLTEAFSVGFDSCSLEPSWPELPFWGERAGDRFDMSTDLNDEGCELPGDETVLVSGVLVMVAASNTTSKGTEKAGSRSRPQVRF